MQIKGLYLNHAEINPTVLMELLAKLNPSEDVDFSYVRLDDLNLDHVKALPDGMQIRGLDLGCTNIPPDVIAPLLAKLNPSGDVVFTEVDLRGLRIEHVMTIPDGMKIQGLNLTRTGVRPDVMAQLFAKLNPSGDVATMGVDLWRLTIEHIRLIPDGMQIKGLYLNHAEINPNVLLELLAKLNPSGDVDFTYVRLDGLNLDYVKAFPKEMNVRSVQLIHTCILPKVKKLLLAKLNPLSFADNSSAQLPL